MRKKGLLKCAIFFAFAAAIISIIAEAKKRVEKKLEALDTYRAYYDLTLNWLRRKEDVCQYFRDNNYKTIGIYGSGTLGELFYENIAPSDVKVACFIEKEPLKTVMNNIPIVSIDNACLYGNLETIVVTPINNFTQIKEDLVNAGVKTDIVSLKAVICGS